MGFFCSLWACLFGFFLVVCGFLFAWGFVVILFVCLFVWLVLVGVFLRFVVG